MTLSPRLPPGRANRKALQYAADIRRLRDAGYTFSAIRLALLDVGISISLTTVKREAARAPAVAAAAAHWPRANSSSSSLAPVQRSPPTPANSDPPFPAVVDTAPSLESIGSFTGTRRTGRQIVDAFMKDRITNPLIQQGVPK